MTTYVERIPLKIHGIEVGTARIHDGGTIELLMRPNSLGQEILELAKIGLVDSLSIVTITTPVTRAAIGSVVPLPEDVEQP